MVPSKIFNILDLAMRARKNGFIFNPLFSGAPGLGKTEIIQQWAVKNKLPFVLITAALYEAPDFKGFPYTFVDENGRTRQSFALPDYWPNSGEGIIILEEVNRGTTSVMNTIMGLTDKRRGFDGYKLPEGWIVASAINPEEGDYDVNTMDPALKDRFEFYHVGYDKTSFVKYMEDSNWDATLRMFVESNTWTYVAPEDVAKGTPGVKYISPRTLSKLNAILQSNVPSEDEMDHYESVLGKNMAKAFFTFKHNEHPVLYSDILTDTKRALKRLEKFSDPKNCKTSYISITIKDIVEGDVTSPISDELLVKVILALPADSGPVLLNNLEYVRKDSTIKHRLFQNYPEVKELLQSVIRIKK